MAFDILYPDDGKESVQRHSSIDQFRNFISVWKEGGWAPILFDQLDGIMCDTVKSHPTIITFEEKPIGYIFPERRCTYSSDHFITADKVKVEEKLLPECYGGKGELYATWFNKRAFINFDGDVSLGLHNKTTLRTGLDYVICDETLPPA